MLLEFIVTTQKLYSQQIYILTTDVQRFPFDNRDFLTSFLEGDWLHSSNTVALLQAST